jgi:hypothetical protein
MTFACISGRRTSYDDHTHQLTSSTQRIHGDRYKCNNCVDFDLCFKCYAHAKQFHNEDHIFMLIIAK